MDSDCLVKLTKAGAKEAILSAMEVNIPSLVKKETVDDAKKNGHRDAFIIEENIEKKLLRVVATKGVKARAVSAEKGEAEVVALYFEGDYEAIASDDSRFLKKLEAADIPYLTPTACLIYLHKSERIAKLEAAKLLESLRPFISRDEHTIAVLYLEDKI